VPQCSAVSPRPWVRLVISQLAKDGGAMIRILRELVIAVYVEMEAIIRTKIILWKEKFIINFIGTWVCRN
jgi:hypothetical protein